MAKGRPGRITGRPSGWIVLAGPDGAGKTSLLDALREQAHTQGVSLVTAHSRPGLLFGKPGDGTPVTDPHAQSPRNPLASLAKLALVFCDHLLGSLIRWRPAARRGLVVVERGYCDMAADPVRYRLPPYLAPLIRILGRLLPRPGLLVLLTGDPESLHARKPEIGTKEITRQLQAWRALAPRAARRTIELDTTAQSPEACAARVLEAAQSEPTWRKVVPAASRLDLRAQGHPSALDVYRPLSAKARTASRLHRPLLAARFTPKTKPPIKDAHALCARLGLDPQGLAAFRSSAPKRWVLGISEKDKLRAVLKAGPLDDRGLLREAEALDVLSDAAAGFEVPSVRFAGELDGRFVLLTDAVRTRRGAPKPDAELAARIATALVRGPRGAGPIVHGDLAPWNILPTPSGPLVIDWEEWRAGAEPLFDLAHYVVQAGALLGTWKPARAVEMLTAPGGVGARHLKDAGADAATAPELLRTYLERTQAAVRDKRARRYRAELTRLLD